MGGHRGVGRPVATTATVWSAARLDLRGGAHAALRHVEAVKNNTKQQLLQLEKVARARRVQKRTRGVGDGAHRQQETCAHHSRANHDEERKTVWSQHCMLHLSVY